MQDAQGSPTMDQINQILNYQHSPIRDISRTRRMLHFSSISEPVKDNFNLYDMFKYHLINVNLINV